MKIRIGYVSNSSSASFLVLEDLTSKGIACLKLTQAQKELINGSKLSDGSDSRFGLDLKRDIYLTQYVSEWDEKKCDIIESIEHLKYENGQMCETPYVEEAFNEYQIDGDTSVYLRKEHDAAVQMEFGKFVKEFKKIYDIKTNVIVKYKEDNCIILKMVE